MLNGLKANDFSTSSHHMSGQQASYNIEAPKDSNSNDAAKITIRKRLKAFAEQTSCHGVQRINPGDDETETETPKRSPAKRVLWSLLTLVSFGMAFTSLGEIVDDYLNYPTSTLIERHADKALEFPAVTFCNLNLVVARKVLQLQEFYFLQGLMGLTEHINLEMASNPVNMESVSGIFGVLTKRDKLIGGHALEDMLLDCRFEGALCDANDFISLYNHRYGMCYTFNSGSYQNGTQRETRLVDRIGEGTGLILTLDVQSDQYIPLSDKVGIKLRVHKSRVHPYMEEQGVSISPGFQTSLGLAKEETIEAGPPHGSCIPVGSEEDRKRNMYVFGGRKYTSMTCVKSCQQAHIIGACGCCDVNTPCNPDNRREMFGVPLPTQGDDGDGGGDEGGSGVPVCNSKNFKVKFNSDVVCLFFTIRAITQNMTCERQCPSECKRVSYETKQSFAVWPNRILAENMFDEINGSSRMRGTNYGAATNNINITTDQKISFVRENILRLDMHFVSKSTLVISTQPDYTWSLLLSNIGGQLGLWLGFSLLTALEFVELLLDVVAHGVQTLLGTMLGKHRAGNKHSTVKN